MCEASITKYPVVLVEQISQLATVPFQKFRKIPWRLYQDKIYAKFWKLLWLILSRQFLKTAKCHFRAYYVKIWLTTFISTKISASEIIKIHAPKLIFTLYKSLSGSKGDTFHRLWKPWTNAFLLVSESWKCCTNAWKIHIIGLVTLNIFTIMI